MMEIQHNTGASLISTTAGAQATSLMELILVRLKKQVEQSRSIGKCVIGAGMALASGPESWPAAAKLAGAGCGGTALMDALD